MHSVAIMRHSFLTFTAVVLLTLTSCGNSASDSETLPPADSLEVSVTESDSIPSLPQLRFSLPSGIYRSSDSLSVAIDAGGLRIRYTLDGSLPGPNSALYSAPILITHNTVIRAYAHDDSTDFHTDTATATYILDTPHSIPVLSLSLDPSDFYSHHSGIYADGPGYTAAFPHTGANYWKHWIRQAHAELFNDSLGGFQSCCGLKIFGGTSRAEAKKSFCLKFKKQYGSSGVTYDFFATGHKIKLKDLVLRAGGQDWNRAMLRDEFFTSLMTPHCPTLLTQAYRPVALYVNAEYFGLYYLREKIDRRFVARHLGVSPDSVTIITSGLYTEEGSMAEFRQLMRYVNTHDMRNSLHYSYVREHIDLQGLIDYKLGEIYSCNTDIGNYRMVYSPDPRGDRKWHFVFYDLDATWVAYIPAQKYLTATGHDPIMGNLGLHNRLIARLLANPDFRALMQQRIDYHLAHTFSEQNATRVFDRLVSAIRPEMPLNCRRWPQLSYESWEKHIADFRQRFSKAAGSIDGCVVL